MRDVKKAQGPNGADGCISLEDGVANRGISMRLPILSLLCVVLLMGGCVRPTVQYLNSVQDKATETEIRAKFGEPYATTTLQDGRYVLHFREVTSSGWQRGCMLWALQFDTDHVLRARDGRMC